MRTLAQAMPLLETPPLETPVSRGELTCQPAQAGSEKASGSSLSTSVKHSLQEKAQLTAALAKVCVLQKRYGRTEAELETLVEGFCWVLGDFPMPDILIAIAQYVRNHTDIPAPADIIAIINQEEDMKKKPQVIPEPTIDDLRRYQRKGIPLTDEQKERLMRADPGIGDVVGVGDGISHPI